MRFFLKQIAQRMGITVAGEATDGEQAVALFKAEQPDLVLLDVNMPHKRGDVALKEILALNARAKVIMLTSVVDMKTVSNCIALGAVSYMLKSSKMEKIKALLSETIEKI